MSSINQERLQESGEGGDAGNGEPNQTTHLNDDPSSSVSATAVVTEPQEISTPHITNKTNKNPKTLRQQRSRSQSRNPRQKPTSFQSEQGAALDEAPPLHFMSSSGRQRRQEHHTPQYLATLMVDHGADSSEASQAVLECPSLATLLNVTVSDENEKTQYLVQPLSRGKLALWKAQDIVTTWRRGCGGEDGDDVDVAQKEGDIGVEDNLKESTGHPHEEMFPLLTKPTLLVDTQRHANEDWIEIIQVPSVTMQSILSNSKHSRPPSKRQSSSNIYLLGLLNTGVLILISIQLPSTDNVNSSTSPPVNVAPQTSRRQPSVPPLSPRVCHTPPPPQSQQSPAKPTFEILARWTMGRGGVTSLAVLHPSATVLVGDENGRLYASRLMMRQAPPQLAKGMMPLQASAPSSKTKLSEIPQWEGFWDHGYTIRSIVQLKLDNEDDSKTTSKETNANRTPEYVIMTVQPKQLLSTPLQLEAINITAIQEKISSAPAPSTNKAPSTRPISPVTDTSDKSPIPKIRLEEFWLLPEPGWELTQAQIVRDKGTSTLGNGSTIRNVHWIPSQGTQRLMSLPPSGKANAGRVALALGDGAGAVLTVSSSADSGLTWGVAHPSVHQWLFSYPCIGMGQVSMPIKSLPVQQNKEEVPQQQQQQPYLACTLRGGTVYLVPISEDNTERPNDKIKVVPYPQDVDFDSPTQHLQSFTAADIKCGTDADEESLPLLFFSWPGGIIDVYACHLVHRKKTKPTQEQHTINQVLEGLISNGAASDLQNFLKQAEIQSKFQDASHPSDEKEGALPTNSPSDDSFIWRYASKEIVKSDQEITLANLQGNNLPNFRALLLELANPSYDLDQALARLGLSTDG